MSKWMLAVATATLICASSAAMADQSGAVTGGVAGAVGGAVVGGPVGAVLGVLTWVRAGCGSVVEWSLQALPHGLPRSCILPPWPQRTDPTAAFGRWGTRLGKPDR
jgi:hypothetical protein